jgi:hypothetical protein
MRSMITSAWSRMRRREEQAQKLISAGRLTITDLADFFRSPLLANFRVADNPSGTELMWQE